LPERYSQHAASITVRWPSAECDKYSATFNSGAQTYINVDVC
jgi:hypothetical protein